MAFWKELSEKGPHHYDAGADNAKGRLQTRPQYGSAIGICAVWNRPVNQSS